MTPPTPDTLREWVVGRYEDDPKLAFIGEIGGSICLVDNLTLEQADVIVSAYNARRIASEQARERAEQALAEIRLVSSGPYHLFAFDWWVKLRWIHDWAVAALAPGEPK